MNKFLISFFFLLTSCLLMNSSNLSVKTLFDLCHFANGLMISGWLMMKVGFTHVTSRNSPTSCKKKGQYSDLHFLIYVC